MDAVIALKMLPTVAGERVLVLVVEEGVPEAGGIVQILAVLLLLHRLLGAHDQVPEAGDRDLAAARLAL